MGECKEVKVKGSLFVIERDDSGKPKLRKMRYDDLLEKA